MDTTITTGNDIESFEKYTDQFEYQKELTKKLDNVESDFNQEIINEIVLWKVNRYAHLNSETLSLLNSFKKEQESYAEQDLEKVLSALLDTKGVKIAMASTILRFKNPEYFQIIDQRVYRILYGQTMPKTTVQAEIIKMYLTYLKDLKLFCDKNNIPFKESDRILYLADKDVNRSIKIDMY